MVCGLLWLLLDVVDALHCTMALHATFRGMDRGTEPVYSLAHGVCAVPTLGTIDGVALNSGFSHHQVSWASL